MHQRRRMAVVVAVLGSLGGAACGGSSGGGTPPPPPATQMAKVSGDSQVATAGALLSPFSVIVKDASGSPVSNVAVTWAVATGGGSVAPSGNTDANGMATAALTLGPSAGTQTATASHAGLTGSPITFTAFSQIQGATSIQANGGSGQSDTVLSTLATPMSVLVHDHNGAPVAGVIVSWSVTGGGSVSQSVDTTDGSGISSVVRTFGGTAGTPGTVATVTGLVGSPVTITATANAGTETQMALSSGNNQTGVINTALANPHSVIVRDAHGNAKSGVTVTWVVGDGGGSVTPSSPVTGSNGVASVTRTLGPSAGPYSDTASVVGLSGSPVAFTGTATTAPLTASVTVGPGTVFSPDSVVIAVGGTVTWTWAPASASHNVQWLTGSPLPTSSAVMTSGTYQWTFTTAGTYTYDCVIHGAIMSGQVVVVP